MCTSQVCDQLLKGTTSRLQASPACFHHSQGQVSWSLFWILSNWGKTSIETQCCLVQCLVLCGNDYLNITGARVSPSSLMLLNQIARLIGWSLLPRMRFNLWSNFRDEKWPETEGRSTFSVCWTGSVRHISVGCHWWTGCGPPTISIDLLQYLEGDVSHVFCTI